jgi:hypothetical protein
VSTRCHSCGDYMTLHCHNADCMNQCPATPKIQEARNEVYRTRALPVPLYKEQAERLMEKLKKQQLGDYDYGILKVSKLHEDGGFEPVGYMVVVSSPDTELLITEERDGLGGSI